MKEMDNQYQKPISNVSGEPRNRVYDMSKGRVGGPMQSSSDVKSTQPVFEVTYSPESIITPGMVNQTQRVESRAINNAPTIVNPAITKNVYLKKSSVQTKHA